MTDTTLPPEAVEALEALSFYLSRADNERAELAVLRRLLTDQAAALERVRAVRDGLRCEYHCDCINEAGRICCYCNNSGDLSAMVAAKESNDVADALDAALAGAEGGEQ